MIDKEKILLITKQYYTFWEKKDLCSLKSLFSDNIILVDPIVKIAAGLSSVIKVNEEIFNGCKIIKIINQMIFVDHYTNTSIGEVKFYYDDKLIEVVDIFSFNEKIQIDKITAYLDTK